MEIDNLEIALQGTSEVGVAAVDLLIEALDKLQSSLGGISSPINKAVKSLDKMSTALNKMGSASGAVKGADQAAASMAKVESAAASTAAGISAAVRGTQQKTVSASKITSAQLKQANYQARLDAKVAAQEQIQANKVVAAQKIAAIKGAQQVEVAAQKAAMAASKQTETQESKASEAEALMAAKRKMELADIAALSEKAAAVYNGSLSGKSGNGSALYPPAELTGSSGLATSTKSSTAATPTQETISEQPLTAFQRIQSGAAKAGQAIRNMFANARSASTAGIPGLEILNAKLDNANEGIRIQELKLAQLRGAWETAFRASGMNDADESVVKLDSAILSARKSLVGYQSEVGRVTAQINKLNTADNETAAGINRVSRSMGTASNRTSELSREISRMGRQLLSQLIIYSMVMPAIQAAGTYMWSALKTNTAFSNSLNNLKVQLLTAFNPIYQAALPALTALITAMARTMAYIAAFISGFFGKTYAQSQQSAAGLNKNVKALEATSKAAKAAKKELAGFDQLNVLASTASTTAAASTGNDKALTNANFGAASAKPLISESQIKAAEAAGEHVRKIWEKIYGFCKKYATPIKMIIAGVIGAFLGFKIITSILDIIQGASSGIDLILANPEVALAVAIVAAIAAIVAALVILYNKNKTFHDAVNGAWASITKAFQNFLKSLVGVKQAWTNLLTIIHNLYKSILKPVFDEIGKVAKQLWDQHLKPMFNEIGKFFSKLINDALEIWNKTLAPFVNWFIKTIGPVILPILKGIVKAVGDVLDGVADVIGGIFKVLGGVIDFITGIFTGNWEKAWQGIEEIFGGIWDAISGIAKSVVSEIIDIVNGIGNAINKIDFSPVQKFFTKTVPGFFSKVGSTVADFFTKTIPGFFSGIGTGISGIWTKVTGFFSKIGSAVSDFFTKTLPNFFTKTIPDNFGKAIAGMKKLWDGFWSKAANVAKIPINTIIGFINSIIDKLNKGITIPSVNVLGQKFGGAHIGLAIPDIPKLATGGIVDSATTFIAGEHGKEAVMPLENNTGWMDKLASKIAAQSGSSRSGDDITHIQVVLDGRTLFESTKKQAKRGSHSSNTLVFDTTN